MYTQIQILYYHIIGFWHVLLLFLKQYFNTLPITVPELNVIYFHRLKYFSQ